MENEKKLSRRGFLKGSMFAVGAVAFLSKMVGTAMAQMIDPAKVPMAKTLKYVVDAAAAKKAGTIDAKYKDGQHCQVCTFYKGDAKMGTCSLIKPGNVAAGGWCKSFNQKKA